MRLPTCPSSLARAMRIANISATMLKRTGERRSPCLQPLCVWKLFWLGEWMYKPNTWVQTLAQEYHVWSPGRHGMCSGSHAAKNSFGPGMGDMLDLAVSQDLAWLGSSSISWSPSSPALDPWVRSSSSPNLTTLLHVQWRR
jgi:hypothetical protein